MVTKLIVLIILQCIHRLDLQVVHAKLIHCYMWIIRLEKIETNSQSNLHQLEAPSFLPNPSSFQPGKSWHEVVIVVKQYIFCI